MFELLGRIEANPIRVLYRFPFFLKVYFPLIPAVFAFEFNYFIHCFQKLSKIWAIIVAAIITINP